MKTIYLILILGLFTFKNNVYASDKILDSLNEEQEIDGQGVVGEKPVINPGESHTYSSGCLLLSPFGAMFGHYKMIEFTTTKKFNVVIPAFKLSAPFAMN